MRSWPDLPPMTSVALTPEVLEAQDAVLIVTDHTAVDYAMVAVTPARRRHARRLPGAASQRREGMIASEREAPHLEREALPPTTDHRT